MLSNKLLTLFTVCFFIVNAFDCDYSSESDLCVDHEQCCGGCCIEGECVDTYRSCYLPFEPCRDHACRGEEDCIVFVPPNCPGCEPIPICKIL